MKHFCTQCGSPLNEQKKFCTTCGKPNRFYIDLQKSNEQINEVQSSQTQCECGAVLPPQSKFCVHCGRKVTHQHPEAKTTVVSSLETVQSEQKQPKVQQQTKKKSGKKIIKFAAVVFLLAVAAAAGYYAFTTFYGGIRKKLLVEQKILPGENDQSVAYKDEITVTVPFGLIDTEETLSISSVKGLPKVEGINVHKAYEVTITNVKQIDGFIEISMKYDPSVIPSGMSASKALTCMYFNESNQQWEAIPFMLNEPAKQITVYTPHLSIFSYGAATQIVEPGPMMKVSTVPFPAGEMIGTDKVVQMLSMYGSGNPSATGQGLLEGWAFVTEWFGIASQVSTFTENALEVGALQGCNQIATEIGLGFALVQAAIDFYNGKKDKSVLELTKNLGNYSALKIFNTTALNVAMVGVFAIDYSLNKFATTAISGRNQIYIDAYNLYYKEKRQQQKINSVWWYKNLKSLARKAQNPAQSGDVILKFMNDYVWEFWQDETTVATYMDRITKGHGFTGGGGLNEQLKKDISNNHLAEIVNVLNETGIFDRIMKELRLEAQGKLYDQLVLMKNKLNTEYPIKIIVKPDPDSKEYEDISLGGLNVRFVTSNPKHKDLWTGKTDRDGEMEFRCTALGYVDAGAPTIVEVEVPSAADKDKTEVFSGTMKLGSSGKITVVEIIVGAPKLEGVWKVEGICTEAKLDASLGGYENFAASYDYVMYGSKENFDAIKRETEKSMIGTKTPLSDLDMNGIELVWKVKKDGEYYIIESPTFNDKESLGGSRYRIKFTGKNSFEGIMEANGYFGGRTNYMKYDVKGTRIR